MSDGYGSSAQQAAGKYSKRADQVFLRGRDSALGGGADGHKPQLRDSAFQQSGAKSSLSSWPWRHPNCWVARSKWTRAISAAPAKASADAALAGKVPVFGLLKRNGRVYVAIIPNVSSATLFPIIRDKIRPDSIVYTDSFSSYDALDVSEFHHVRINHSELFADQANHINGIENFWNQAKRHLRSFNGIPSRALSPVHQRVRMALQQPARCKPHQTALKMVGQVTLKPLSYVSP